MCTSALAWCIVLLSVKLVGESKFSPPPGQLVEKLIDSGVATIVTVTVYWWSGVTGSALSNAVDSRLQRCKDTATWKNKDTSKVSDMSRNADRTEKVRGSTKDKPWPP